MSGIVEVVLRLALAWWRIDHDRSRPERAQPSIFTGDNLGAKRYTPEYRERFYRATRDAINHALVGREGKREQPGFEPCRTRQSFVDITPRAMGDINHFANDLLLDFVDAFHARLKAILENKFGGSWLDRGVRRHFKPEYFDRAQKMLNSPMRVIDLNKSDEDLYGVEHLATIVVGNWEIFKPHLDNKARTEVYLAEVVELRHNLSHRRKRHILRRRELLRFVENCRLLLRAIESPAASKFDSLAESMSQGGSPWGSGLGGSLPNPHEIVREFVGRPQELQRLSEWLLGNAPQVLVFGYGGAGKSATAFQFARQVQDGGLEGLQAVCWASAKKREFVEGQERGRRADFTNIASFAGAVFETLYGSGGDSFDEDELLKELDRTPALVIVDDLDTVLGDEQLAEFLLFRLRQTRSRFVFTSRNKVPGLPTIEILGFATEELREFVRVRATDYGLDAAACESRLAAVGTVTGAFPLFVDDLLRYARLAGIDRALVEWQQRKGDAARAYALRRQLEQLGGAAQDTLIGISVASRPLTALEIATISGSADDDVEKSLQDLAAWRLIDRVATDGAAEPAFDMNANTRRLVQKTCSNDERLQRYATAFQSYSGQRLPPGMQRAIASVVLVARSMVVRDDIDGAIAHVSEAMRGDLRQSADLHGVLGWICSRHLGARDSDARAAFQKAHELGARSRDTYYHWARMEIELAETGEGVADPEEVLRAWRQVGQVVQWGVNRCGDSRGLCQFSSYAHCREARFMEEMQQFAAAQGAYKEAHKWAVRALAAPVGVSWEPAKDVVYRSMVLALEGLGDTQQIAAVFQEWEKADPRSNYLASESERLRRRFPELLRPGT